MLTKEQIKNLKVFLGRVQLQGSEVPAFIEALKALNEENKEDKKDVKPK